MTTALLLIGHGSRDQDAVLEYQQFAERLAVRLQTPVTSCFLELADPPIVDGIRACIEAGARRVLALPLFLGPAGHQKNDVPAIINWAKTEWPDVQFTYGTPLGTQPQIINVLARRAEQTLRAADSSQTIAAADTALIVMGRGSRDPDSNSDVHKIARLLWEGREYGWVEAAFYSLTQPSIPTTVERCIRLGAKRVVILPYLLFTGVIARRTTEKAHAVQADHPEVEILVGGHLGDDPDLLEAAVYRYEQMVDGTAAMTCDLCKYRHQFTGFEAEYGLPQTSDHNHGLRGVPHNHGLTYDIALSNILPPRYQGDDNGVSAAPMGAADLQYTADGQVAWDQIWTGFCDLAMAGGAPHRGELLEPVSPEEVQANPDGYQQVLQELERGVNLVSNLPTVSSKAPGWLGVACHDETMALWLLRAIIVENIAVRREGNILYLPAGPNFTLHGEIKNVITTIAKTHHYWTEHIAAMS